MSYPVACCAVFSLDVPAPTGDILTRGTLRDADRDRDRDRDSGVDKSPTAKLSELPSLAGCSSFGERVIFLRSNLKSLTAKVEVQDCRSQCHSHLQSLFATLRDILAFPYVLSGTGQSHLHSLFSDIFLDSIVHCFLVSSIRRM